MTCRFLAALVLTSCSMTWPASAQDLPPLALSPANPARWDIAFHVGWVGENKSEIAPDWNEWYDAASVDAAAGYYWTAHLKLELDLATTTKGGIFVQEVIWLPGDSVPYVQSREHTFRTTSLAGGVTYQFLENRWFHPFVSGGVSVVHEHERVYSSFPGFLPRDPLPPSVSESASISVRPFAALGFKAYTSERVFIRTDVRVTGSRQHAESVGWRGGVGFDF